MARILIVDDEIHILRIMAMWLAKHGHDIIEARDGSEALALVEHHRPDLIISDMNMPRINGVELVRTLRETHRLDAPVLLLTARCDHAELEQRLAPYRVHLHPKPFIPSRLVDQIDRLLCTAVAE